jgi:uncharacterized protein
VSDLRARLRSGLKDALKARNRPALDALRSALAAIGNAEAAETTHTQRVSSSEYVAGAVVGVGAGEVPRRHLSDDDIERVVLDEISALRDAAAQARDRGQEQVAASLSAEAEVLAAYVDP